MILVVDVGNSFIKTAVFENNTILETQKNEYENWQKNLKIILNNFKSIQEIVISSVGKIEKSTFETVFDDYAIHFITKNDLFPFKNLYATPETLGIDRMVLSAGAVIQFPKKNRLVIDAGTCVTYDFIDENDNYLGGAISPGIRLRYEALHNYTAKLPKLNIENPENVIGNSTNNAIHSGVINGLTFEIDGYIASHFKQNENFIIILTGGDANFLSKRLKNTIFANSNFLLESLNQTYQYNKQNVQKN